LIRRKLDKLQLLYKSHSDNFATGPGRCEKPEIIWLASDAKLLSEI